MKLFDYAERLKQLPPYLFKEIDRKKTEVMARGVDIIDLGVVGPACAVCSRLRCVLVTCIVL